MAGQNYANANTETLMAGQDAQPPQPLITPAQDIYITFVAAHGLSVDEGGEYNKVTAIQLADKLGVHRNTFYTWQRTIPDFWDKVDARRREIFGRNRVNAVWRGLLLQALKGSAKQAEMILSHYSDYVPPTQRHEVKVSGLGELYSIARKKKTQDDNAT